MNALILRLQIPMTGLHCRFLSGSLAIATMSLATSGLTTLSLATGLPIPLSQPCLTVHGVCTWAQLLVPLQTEGTRIYLNGRTVTGYWQFQGDRLGLADMTLMQLMGAELGNTQDPSQQPIAWFSDDTNSPILPSWFAGQHRYLDVTDLGAIAGWQWRSNGTTLILETPTAQIQGIRQSSQPWGQRWVIDLDQPTPWQVVEQDESIRLTLSARAIAGSIPTIPGLQITPQDHQTQIQLHSTVSGATTRTWTLSNPPRLVVDFRTDAIPDRDIQWSPGIRWVQQSVQLGNRNFPVVYLVVDLQQAELTLSPIWGNPNGAEGINPLLSTAQQSQAIAAINGGFFNRNNQLPLGAIRQDGRWISGPILNRGAIAWNDAGQVVIDRLTLQETLITDQGTHIPVLFLNSGYVQAGLSRYTPDWGSHYTTLIDQELVITVQNGQITQHQRGSTAGQTTIPIPRDGYLLTARSFNSVAADLPVGHTVELAGRSLPDDFNTYPNSLGAGPLLIQNRQIVLDPTLEQFSEAFIRQAAPRSAIGINAQGQLLLVAMQPQFGGSGPTLTEAAQIMQHLGSVDALNLDGGSSTSLILGGQLLNRSPRTAARVHNGLGLFFSVSSPLPTP